MSLRLELCQAPVFQQQTLVAPWRRIQPGGIFHKRPHPMCRAYPMQRHLTRFLLHWTCGKAGTGWPQEMGKKSKQICVTFSVAVAVMGESLE